MERRLTTILSAEIAEALPPAIGRATDLSGSLVDQRAAVVASLMVQAGGRFILTRHDGFLAEFGSVVSAVSFALNLQREIDESNSTVQPDLRQCYRIGINLWDMVVSDRNVLGEGVNVAVKLQALAAPGEVLISDNVYQHVHRNLVLEDRGSHQLTEVQGLIHAYRILGRRQTSSERSVQASLAVLPFSNLSGDPEQSYFSDGFTEDISSSLSKVSALFVVSRDLHNVGEAIAEILGDLATDLGVQHLLHGSINRDDEKVHITARLVDGHINKPVWTGRYDCDSKGIFDVQDQIRRDVIDALGVKIPAVERETLGQRATRNSEAYRFYLMGRSYFHRGHTRRFLRLARQMFQRAVDIEADYAAAHAGIADCCSHLLEAGDFSVTTEEIFTHSERALALDPSVAEAHASRGLALYTIGRYDDAQESFERALALQPDLFEAYYFYGRNCFNLGQFSKAADLFGQAAKLKRDDFRSLGLQSMCFQAMAQLSEARTAARSALARTEAAVARRPDEGDALSFGAGLLAFLGEYKRTKDWAERASIVEPDDFYINYNVACALALLGATEEALDRLERIMEPIPPRSQREHMIHDSDLDGLRDHPRFLRLLKRLEDQ